MTPVGGASSAALAAGVQVGIPWEVGIFAHDLERSVADLARQLGLTFRDLLTARVDHIEDPDPGALEFRYTMSFEGPPYIEVIEAVEGSGLHDPALPDGLHHLGVWVDDLEAHHARLTTQGVRAEARAYLEEPDGTRRLMTWFNDPRDLQGIRFEFLPSEFRPIVEEWLRSPPGTPHPMG
jgi:catechol 2,3-dioxygenase-like lactoylglutathione lyase family enzyme